MPAKRLSDRVDLERPSFQICFASSAGRPRVFEVEARQQLGLAICQHLSFGIELCCRNKSVTAKTPIFVDHDVDPFRLSKFPVNGLRTIPSNSELPDNFDLAAHVKKDKTVVLNAKDSSDCDPPDSFKAGNQFTLAHIWGTPTIMLSDASSSVYILKNKFGLKETPEPIKRHMFLIV